jgi:hypothetical protein
MIEMRASRAGLPPTVIGSCSTSVPWVDVTFPATAFASASSREVVAR